MHVKYLSICCSILFFVGACAPVDSFAGNTGIVYVDDDNVFGPWDGTMQYPFRFIQEGINHAQPGDTVFISAGLYREHVLIDKTVSITGENETRTIIDGVCSGTICTITASDVLIEQCTLRNSGGNQFDAGIKSTSDVTVRHCSIFRTRIGILINDSSHVLINNCTIHTNGVGIFFQSSQEGSIEGCILAHNAIGVVLENSQKIILAYSYLHTNGRACYIYSSQLITINRCNISDNSVNHGGVFIQHSSHITVNNSILAHNGAGMSITSSDFIQILFCKLYVNTHFALWMQHQSTQIKIHQCIIERNLRFGVYAVDGCSYELTQNTFRDNTIYALYTQHSSGNIQKNYWSSLRGPMVPPAWFGENVNHRHLRVAAVPWLLHPPSTNGPTWEKNPSYLDKPVRDTTQKTINISDTDTDCDGAGDTWEQQWGYDPVVWDDHYHFDPDDDGLNNIEECFMQSHPFYKDIFVEIDYVKSIDAKSSNKPSEEMIAAAVAMFAKHDIALHIDVGSLGGGEEIPRITNFSFLELENIYWKYFLHNDMNNPRKGIFRYGLICDYGPDVNFPFIGWNHLDSFLISAQALQEKLPYISKDRIIIGGIIHHLGHTMNLLADTFDGIDNIMTLKPFSVHWFKYLQYKSCMNYYYKYTVLDYSDGAHGLYDFDDWSHLDLKFFKNSSFFQQPQVKQHT